MSKRQRQCWKAKHNLFYWFSPAWLRCIVQVKYTGITRSTWTRSSGCCGKWKSPTLFLSCRWQRSATWDLVLREASTFMELIWSSDGSTINTHFFRWVEMCHCGGMFGIFSWGRENHRLMLGIYCTIPGRFWSSALFSDRNKSTNEWISKIFLSSFAQSSSISKKKEKRRKMFRLINSKCLFHKLKFSGRCWWIFAYSVFCGLSLRAAQIYAQNKRVRIKQSKREWAKIAQSNSRDFCILLPLL